MKVVSESIARLEQQIIGMTRRIDDLTELAGEGTNEDRAALKSKVREAQMNRASLQADLARLKRSSVGPSVPITAERVGELLEDLSKLLEDGASGRLGQDLIYKAATVFRQLVGGRIDVHVETRLARKQSNVRGTFVPALLRTIQAQSGQHQTAASTAPESVSVWLRSPPKRDLLAERVHQLIDIDKLSYRAAAKVMQAEGHNINSGIVWQIYHRYYEMIGQPVPKVPFNNGHPRMAV